MRKKAKESHHTINTNTTSVKTYTLKPSQKCLIWRSKPITDKELDALGDELIEWATNDESAYKLSTFWNAMRLDKSVIFEWTQRYEPFKKAISIAKSIIGDRRELQALHFKIHPGIVMKTMAMYDSDYKDLCEWESKLSSKEHSPLENKIVVIERFPDQIEDIKKLHENRNTDKA